MIAVQRSFVGMSGEPPGARVIHMPGSVVDLNGAGREQIRRFSVSVKRARGVCFVGGAAKW